jgi:hypothetical protein
VRPKQVLLGVLMLIKNGLIHEVLSPNKARRTIIGIPSSLSSESCNPNPYIKGSRKPREQQDKNCTEKSIWAFDDVTYYVVANINLSMHMVGTSVVSWV